MRGVESVECSGCGWSVVMVASCCAECRFPRRGGRGMRCGTGGCGKTDVTLGGGAFILCVVRRRTEFLFCLRECVKTLRSGNGVVGAV